MIDRLVGADPRVRPLRTGKLSIVHCQLSIVHYANLLYLCALERKRRIMEKIRLRDKTFKLFIPEAAIGEAIARMAAEIKRDIAGKDVLFVCILNGAFMFASELLAEMDDAYEVSFARYSSYAGTSSTHELKEIMPIKENVRGRTVVLLEDIIDTGFTMQGVLARLKELGAAEVKLATMLFKPESLQCELKPDYVGIRIPPAFIVGHGLDYDGLGRAYRDIYVIDN